MGIIQTKAPKQRIPGPEPVGRVCSNPTCQTILSTYNGSDRCAPCGGWPRKQIVKTVDELHELMEAA